MEIKATQAADGSLWVSVYYRGSCVADFASKEAAERYVRRMGHFVRYL